MACGADREEWFGLAKTFKDLSRVHELFQLMFVGGVAIPSSDSLAYLCRAKNSWRCLVADGLASCFALATDVPSGATEEGQGLRSRFYRGKPAVFARNFFGAKSSMHVHKSRRRKEISW
jgi:hypothetical protein